RMSRGRWEYRLLWPHLPGHTGDVVHLNVHLPPGWRWDGRPPPATAGLDRDIGGAWTLSSRRAS
ncbi:MAG: hypothetical protein LC792_14000, partial [Actinobacteria bacterium]|nr:hypothetical protein [Actinomycetota bacterium]